MKKTGIYKILNKISGKFYIGSAININRRYNIHKRYLKQNKHENRYLQNAWNKHGEGNFVFEILEWVDNRELLFEREQEWLDETRCYERNVGYNICKKSDRPPVLSGKDSPNWGRFPSSETRKRISESHKGIQAGEKNPMYGIRRCGKDNQFYGKKHTEEAKKKMSISSKGNKHRLGKSIPEEQKKQISETLKGKYVGEDAFFYGRKHTEESKRKMSESSRNRKHSEETKKKISEINKSQGRAVGENNPMSKLNKKKVEEIRESYEAKEMNQKQLAEKYRVTRSLICYIVNYKIWIFNDEL